MKNASSIFEYFDRLIIQTSQQQRAARMLRALKKLVAYFIFFLKLNFFRPLFLA